MKKVALKYEVCHASLYHGVGVPRRLGNLEHVCLVSVSSSMNGVVHSCEAFFGIYFYVKFQWVGESLRGRRQTVWGEDQNVWSGVRLASTSSSVPWRFFKAGSQDFHSVMWRLLVMRVFHAPFQLWAPTIMSDTPQIRSTPELRSWLLPCPRSSSRSVILNSEVGKDTFIHLSFPFCRYGFYILTECQ